jgi:hypothetical protein
MVLDRILYRGNFLSWLKYFAIEPSTNAEIAVINQSGTDTRKCAPVVEHSCRRITTTELGEGNLDVEKAAEIFVYFLAIIFILVIISDRRKR